MHRLLGQIQNCGGETPMRTNLNEKNNWFLFFHIVFILTFGCVPNFAHSLESFMDDFNI